MVARQMWVVLAMVCASLAGGCVVTGGGSVGATFPVASVDPSRDGTSPESRRPVRPSRLPPAVGGTEIAALLECP
jgi:hypothetical protein